VLEFWGRERVNDVYVYSVTFATLEPAELLHAAVFGDPACLTIKAPGHEPRIIQGIVSAFEPLGHIGTRYESEMLAYNLTIVPKLWLLTRSARSRIFQNKSVPDIVKRILTEHGVTDVKDSLTATYEPREYCVQYQETAFDFVSRLLESEGIPALLRSRLALSVHPFSVGSQGEVTVLVPESELARSRVLLEGLTGPRLL